MYAYQLAKLFLDNVFSLHGLPRIIIGDRDSRHISTFFKSLMEEPKTTLSLSTAYRPQTDGNTEMCHRTMLTGVLRKNFNEGDYVLLSTD